MSNEIRRATAVQALLADAADRLNAGALDDAEALCRRALSLQPDSMRGLAILGAICHARQRFEEAGTIFDELTQRQPREPTHWMNLGTARRGVGRYDEALAAYTRAAQLGLLTADFYFNVGLTHLDRRDYESARAVLKRAVELAPGDAQIRFEYVKACYESMQTDEAVAALEGWTDFSGLSPELLADIGHRLMNLGQAERAEAAVRQLARSSTLDARAMLTLLQIFERTNRLEEAHALLARLMADPRASNLGSELIVARALLAQRASNHEEAVSLFRVALAQTKEVHDRHYALFPLAKSLDALGRYDEAFTALVDAHASQVAYMKLSAPLAVARGAPTMEITRYGCDEQDVARWTDSSAPDASTSPIFVLAFPRSGTTLLEQTLDAHPMLCSIDEQPLVQNALDDILGFGVRYPEQLARLQQSQLEEVRARYYERAAKKMPHGSGQRLVDKNPLNLLRLPAIHRVFPNARIILAIRHPCDVVLSCFMQHFRAPEFALLCADLRTLALGYQRSFDFWYEQVGLLRPAVLEVRYEEFVADFENGARELAAFLDLPWHEAMLAPAAHARAKGFISTPSYAQVVQPVSQKAVGRWRTYANQLAPVIPLLRPYLERWRYEAPT